MPILRLISLLNAKMKRRSSTLSRLAGTNFHPGLCDGSTKSSADLADSRRSARYMADRMLAGSVIALDDATGAMFDAKIDALVTDQAEFPGETIADYLKAPFVNAILPMPLHLESNVPFFAFNLRHGSSLLHKMRN
jgi:hypothetical protein